MPIFSKKLAGLETTGEVAPDVCEFMSDADLERFVLVHLRPLGWHSLPGTRTVTTAHYECVLVSCNGGERGIVQVKSGHAVIDAARYAGEEKAFLFAASGSYGATLPPNVVVITRDDLTDFMCRTPHLLPRAVARWMALPGLPAA